MLTWVGSAILGMAFLIASIPLPSLIGVLLNRIQTERMKRTDSRVQAVTECMFLLHPLPICTPLNGFQS